MDMSWKEFVSTTKSERGAAMMLAIIAAAVMAMIGGGLALIIQNEARSEARAAAYDQALYVAEAGIEDVLYQRSKDQSSLCFPYTDDGSLSGVPGAMDSGSPAVCIDNPADPRYDPAYDADTADADRDILPCRPYNEKFYANRLVFGPNFYCNDGSDPVNCPSYKPLGVWPAGLSGQAAWKDINPQKPAPLTSAAASSGKRYSTALFTVCNDDFVGDDLDVEPAKSHACLNPPCARRVSMLSLVSVGEVQIKPGETIRRAVKVDIIPPALYSGVIDKYVDITGITQFNINGPVHINGWWNPDIAAYSAFMLTAGLSPGALLSDFDPPDIVSVSYPENPLNPDWQPPLGLGQITYVHLPVKIDIPNVNWNQFEDRMKKLYDDALGLYAGGRVNTMRRDDYNPSNMYDPYGDGSNEFECYSTNGLGQPSYSLGDSGKTVGLISSNVEFSNCREAGGLLEMICPGPWNDPQCCSPNARDGRIHNCNRDSAQEWDNVAFDLYDVNTASWVTGTEPGHLGGGPGARDNSLRYVPKEIYDLHFSGGGCGLLNPFACLTRTVNRPEFVFMGRHEYQGKIFIDGTMGIGTRTPYHTCGEGDGGLTFFCVIIPSIPLGFATIPSWHFGVPHWHTGSASIKGEMLVNGSLYMADYVNIDGGAVYADGNVIKDETSAVDVILNVSDLLKSLIVLLFPELAVPPVSLLFNLLWAGVDLVMQGFFAWWPEVDLTNSGYLDFETYLDINGWNQANVINSGTIYTRGDFRYLTPDFDPAIAMVNTLIGQFIPIGGFNLKPATDPVRIWNYGAIIAGGREIAPGAGLYRDGNIILDDDARLDVLVGDPANPDNNIPSNAGYLFARGSLSVYSDIISHYTTLGFLNIDKCSSEGIFLQLDDALEPECAARGIFYSGGVADHYINNTAMFGSTPSSLEWSGGFQNAEVKCLNEAEPEFWTDPLGNIGCWAKKYLGGDSSEFNIRGYVFAGQAGAMPSTYLRLDQDSSVLHTAVERRYYQSLISSPVDWMEIDPPLGVPKLP